LGLLLSVALIAAFVSAPAFAQCGVDTACVILPAGSTGEDIAQTLEASWDLPDFICSASGGGSFVVTDGDSQVAMTFSVSGGTTGVSHTFDLRVEPGVGPLPIQVFVDFDSQGEMLLGDRTHVFADITIVSSISNGPSGPLLPMLDSLRTLLLVAGLAIGGLAYVLWRR